MSLLPGYFQHSTFYPILVILLMDGSVADRSMSCTQLSSPAVTTVFRGDGCFLLSREARTWEESDTFCKDLGSGWSLVVIEDAETQRHVDNLTLTAGVSSGSWIGLHQQGNKYTWVSGNPLDYPDFFRQLRQGETSSTGGCVTTSPPVDTTFGTWYNAECTTRLSTICHTTTSSLHRTTTFTTTSTTTSTSTSTPTSTITSTSTSTTSSITTLIETPAKTQTTVKDKKTPSTTATTQAKPVATTTSSVKSSTEREKIVPASSSTRATTPSVQARPMTDSTPRTSTKPTVQTTPSIVTDKLLIPVTSGVAVVAAVAVVVVVIILCRRIKAKRLRVRTIDTDTGDERESGDVRTNPEVVYAVVTPGRKTQTSQDPRCDADPGYHYIPVDSEDSAVQGVTDPMYDTATASQGKQVTLDNTYDRAMFRQSGDDVYDHTSLTRKSPQAHDTSLYDHAIVQ